MSIEKDEGDKAFEAVLDTWYLGMKLHRPAPPSGRPPRDKWYSERMARAAFNAGMKRGEEKRGCLHELCAACEAEKEAR